MPRAALKPCSYLGCLELVTSGRCKNHPYPDVHDPDSQKLYNTRRWKRIRARQLTKEPWCADCLKQNIYTLATDCDHIEPHRGDPVKFFKGPFQSLCHSHHSQKTDIEIGWGGGLKSLGPGERLAGGAIRTKKSPRSKFQIK